MKKAFLALTIHRNSFLYFLVKDSASTEILFCHTFSYHFCHIHWKPVFVNVFFIVLQN